MARGDALARGAELERRILAAGPPIPPSPDALHDQVRKFLVQGSDESALKTAPWQVHRLIFPAVRDLARRGIVVIQGGRKGSVIEVFERADGACFEFGITIDYDSTEPTLVSYRFKIRYPEGAPVPFLRYDLNPPDRKPGRGALFEPRCHLHAGHQEVRVPSPLVHPVELLALLIYGP